MGDKEKVFSKAQFFVIASLFTLGAVVMVSCGSRSVMKLDDTPTFAYAPQSYRLLLVELNRQLAKQGEARADTPVLKASSSQSVGNLSLLTEKDGSVSLLWTYVNTGDYNLGGTVSVQDITPLAENFWKRRSEFGWGSDFLEVVDGNRDGIINIGDVTPIAENFQRNVYFYSIQAKGLES